MQHPLRTLNTPSPPMASGMPTQSACIQHHMDGMIPRGNCSTHQDSRWAHGCLMYTRHAHKHCRILPLFTPTIHVHERQRAPPTCIGATITGILVAASRDARERVVASASIHLALLRSQEHAQLRTEAGVIGKGVAQRCQQAIPAICRQQHLRAATQSQ
eukprot:973587-Pelagomonas_calceolata.AAC.6